ncbi:D-glycero-alpha-D-manno-heptose-1,7-bisphosphate 7-phosphatase [Kitasatospora sp. NPDC059646]|uniref:D-glycero-alpha-D-manno-heptose-1,7-bisphosphate 7-phosphatase n=1 Tax=Kitasatospora sp. NPDC059646 TaxID=3346893 RepID=UPI00369833F5
MAFTPESRTPRPAAARVAGGRPVPEPRPSGPVGAAQAAPWIRPGRTEQRRAAGHRTAAVLLDRDGTLIEGIAYNGDPGRVYPRRGVREALEELRALGLPLGVVTNQSGVGRGILTRDQVEVVNRRVEEMLGPFDVWAVCPHTPADRCECRKPAPGLVLAAIRALRADPRHATVIGDTGADLAAAAAAGAHGILVPSLATLPEEIETAGPHCAADLPAAVRKLPAAATAPR